MNQGFHDAMLFFPHIQALLNLHVAELKLSSIIRLPWPCCLFCLQWLEGFSSQIGNNRNNKLDKLGFFTAYQTPKCSINSKTCSENILRKVYSDSLWVNFTFTIWSCNIPPQTRILFTLSQLKQQYPKHSHNFFISKTIKHHQNVWSQDLAPHLRRL